MNIGITGSSGLIGRALAQKLAALRHTITPIKRDVANFFKINRDDKFDAIFHLAGEPIANGLWTREKKRRIFESRVLGTKALVEQISKLHSKPHTFICASAVGIYGDRGDEVLSEKSKYGSGFLADTAILWEQEAKKLESVRVVCARFGVVLSKNGGALKPMLLPFKLGLGATLGTGKQYMSWISINDVIDALIFLLNNQKCSGSFNLVSPNPVTNYEFTKTLAVVLKRPALFRAPEFILKTALGELSQIVLSSQRAMPNKLISEGFSFSTPDLSQALKYILDKRSEQE